MGPSRREAAAPRTSPGRRRNAREHLETLNDTIFEITGVRVRETFPDRVLDEADEVVLVDLAPEALRQRLEAGKVYPPTPR